MAAPNLSELVTLAIENRTRRLRDNVTNNTALLQRLNERGNIRPADGGRTILEEIEYAENQTFRWYSGYEVLDISPSEVFSAAEYNWKQCAVAVSFSGLEELQVMGRARQIPLVSSKIRNAERTMRNQMSASVYSDGTGDGGKQIGGIQLLISDAGTGTVGGIDSSAFSFWQNQIYDFSVEGVTADASGMQTAMNELWLRTKRNNDEVDLIVADNNYYTLYWSGLQQIQRIMSPTRGEAGFGDLRFKNAAVIPDGGQGGSCPTDRMYFLNTEYLGLRPHSARNMVPLAGGERRSVNQDALVRFIAWTGNMTCANRSLQGVILP